MLVEPINWDIGPTFNVRKMLLGIVIHFLRPMNRSFKKLKKNSKFIVKLCLFSAEILAIL